MPSVLPLLVDKHAAEGEVEVRREPQIQEQTYHWSTYQTSQCQPVRSTDTPVG